MILDRYPHTERCAYPHTGKCRHPHTERCAYPYTGKCGYPHRRELVLIPLPPPFSLICILPEKIGQESLGLSYIL